MPAAGSGSSHLMPGEREIHIKDLAAVVLRHWRVAALFPVLVAGGAFLGGRGTVHEYQSHVMVRISSPKQVFARRGDDFSIDELALQTDPILSEALMLTTQRLAMNVVDHLRLRLELTELSTRRGNALHAISVDSVPGVPIPLARYELIRHPLDWELHNAAGAAIASGPYETRVEGPGFSFFTIPPDAGEDVIPFGMVSREAAAALVTGGISYSVRRATTAVDISFTGTDPTLVPNILNAAAVQWRDMGVDRAREAASRRTTYIRSQLGITESQHQEKLIELQRFRETQQITDLSADEAAIVSSIHTAEREKQDILIYAATLSDALQSGSSVGLETLNRLSAVGEIQTNSALSFQIRSLLELYESRRAAITAEGLRESNPHVIRLDQLIQEAHVALTGAVQAALEGAEARIAAVDDRIGNLRDELATYPGKATSLAQLQLEVNILNQTLQYLLRQYETARMQAATIGPYIAVLDSASPAVPLGTSLRRKIMLGFLVGVLLGLGSAFFLEYLDQTIKSSSDIERVLGIPVLGLIPQDPGLAAGSSSDGRRPLGLITDLDAADPSTEAYRSLRTNVTFVGAEKPLQFLTVTSAGPSEGKSTTAINLALTLAMSGSKTILIDADLRRPLGHVTFGVEREPGLTDVLIGGKQANRAVRSEVKPNLDMLTAGASPPNPSELLGSEAMHALIVKLRRKYDYIVADSPPVLPVTDSAVLASSADATILVVHCGSTEEEVAKRALAKLRRVHARVAGAVLNGVTQKHEEYYYTYYSYKGATPARSRLRLALGSRLAEFFQI